MNSSSSKKRSSPAELSWVRANYDLFDHVLFFNYFVTYKKPGAIRRFKTIVEQWINNTHKKEALLENFKEWNKTKESKLYWKQRAKTETEQSDSTSFVSFCGPSSSTSTKTKLPLATNLTKELNLFFIENIQLSEVSNRYFIDNIDVSFMFHHYQKQVYEHAKKELFSFKSNYHELLCLSSVLLLENNSTNSIFLRVFGHNNLHKIITHLKVHSLTISNNEFLDSDEFLFERMVPVFITVKKVFKKSITREEGCLQLINIGMNLQGTQNVIVRFIKKMLESFPLNDLGETIKEDDLKSRYILPILQSLFDNLDDENTVFFKVTNENNAECKQKGFNVSHRRPDGQFRQKAEHKNFITIGYMEAKPESESKNYDACMQDLFRLATFGKNAIDIYYLKSTLLIQAIGPTFTFYLLQKKSEDIYSMVELDKFNFPMNINQIPAIFGYLDRITVIVEIFKKYVRPVFGYQ